MGWAQADLAPFGECPVVGGGSETDCDLNVRCDDHEYDLSCEPDVEGDTRCVCRRDGTETVDFVSPVAVCSIELMRVRCPE